MIKVLQLTDTDEAFIIKAGPRSETTIIVGEMKAAAKDESEGFGHADFRC